MACGGYSFYQIFNADEEEQLWGSMTLYYGCRQAKMDNIYREETKKPKEDGVLANVFTALSREPNYPKVCDY